MGGLWELCRRVGEGVEAVLVVARPLFEVGSLECCAGGVTVLSPRNEKERLNGLCERAVSFHDLCQIENMGNRLGLDYNNGSRR